MSEVSMETPQKPNVFFQLIKGLAYFLLFLASQVVASYVLIFYYVFKYMFQLPAGADFDATQITEEAMEMVFADINSLLIIYAFILVVFLFIFFALRKKRFLNEIQFRKFSPKYLPAMALLTFGLYFFVTSILNFLPESLMKSYAESSSFISEGSFAVSMITQALIAPFTEELVFRGLMLSRFNKALPKWIGITISSLFFGLVHGNPVWFVYAAALGCIFCIVAERTGSIFSTFLMHCVFNASGTIFAYLFPRVTTMELIVFLIIGLPMITTGLYLLLYTHNVVHAARSQDDK